MNKLEAILKLSQEGRAWAELLMPTFVAFCGGGAIGWHMPQPPWMNVVKKP